MTRRIITAVALLALGYAIGVAQPNVLAADPTSAIVSELRGIRGELTSIRRAMEKR